MEMKSGDEIAYIVSDATVYFQPMKFVVLL